MVFMKGRKKKKTLNWSLSLNQIELGFSEQIKIFTKSFWVPVVNGDCHSFFSLLTINILVLLLCPDDAGVGKIPWRGALAVRPGRVIEAYSLSVWFLRGMENESYFILGPQIGTEVEREEETLHVASGHSNGAERKAERCYCLEHVSQAAAD